MVKLIKRGTLEYVQVIYMIYDIPLKCLSKRYPTNY